MPSLSISGLSELTGFARETVAKRLSAANLQSTLGPQALKLFESVQALRAIFEVAPDRYQGDLMRARCRNLDLDSELKKQHYAIASGELLPAAVVEQIWSGMTGAARTSLLALPYRLGANCANESASIVENKARELIYEALENLSKFDPADYLASQMLEAESTDLA